MKRLAKPLQAAVSIAILLILYWQIPFADVFDALATAAPAWILSACAIALVIEVLATQRLKALTDHQGFKLPFGKLLHITLASRFYKLFLPGGMLASIAVRFYKLQRADTRRPEAMSAVLADRILATFGLCLIGVVFWAIDRSPAEPTLGWLLFAAMLAVTMLLGLSLSRRAGRMLRDVVDALPIRLLGHFTDRLLSAMSAFRHLPKRRMVAMLLITILQHIAGTLVIVCLGLSVGIVIDIVTWGWIRSAVVQLTMLPVSLAGLGIRDVAMLSLLGAYGVSGPDALAMAFLVFGVTALLGATLGGLLEGITFFRAANSRP